tara:strand:- start:7855 stop:8661 length:807 start_codon:yes stop_codon:yes gene_type:complete
VNILEAVILGTIQGISEWLPLSSEGLVTASGIIFFDNTASHSFSMSLVMHFGSGIAALVYFRKDIKLILRDFLIAPKVQSKEATFLLYSTLTSGIIAIPLMLIMENLVTSGFFQNTSEFSMLIIGISMIGTGCVLRYSNKSSNNFHRDPSMREGIITGIAQGLSVIPGISRSGITISTMVIRGFDHNQALKLSFIMCIPVTIASGVYALIFQSVYIDSYTYIAITTSFISSLFFIKILLLIVNRFKFWIFAVSIGLIIFLSSLTELII